MLAAVHIAELIHYIQTYYDGTEMNDALPADFGRVIITISTYVSNNRFNVKCTSQRLAMLIDSSPIYPKLTLYTISCKQSLL